MGLFKKLKAAKSNMDAVISAHNDLIKKCENMTPEELKEVDDTALGEFLMERFYENWDLSDCKHDAQRVYFVVVNLQYEVANGGLQQFFDNSSNACAPYVSASLAAIGAPEAKALFDRYISQNGIDVQNYDDVDIGNSDDFDDEYYEMMGDIDSLLLQFARDNMNDMMEHDA